EEDQDDRLLTSELTEMPHFARGIRQREIGSGLSQLGAVHARQIVTLERLADRLRIRLIIPSQNKHHVDISGMSRVLTGQLAQLGRCFEAAQTAKRFPGVSLHQPILILDRLQEYGSSADIGEESKRLCGPGAGNGWFLLVLQGIDEDRH